MKVLIGALLAMTALAQDPQTIRLWSGDAPGAMGSEDKDVPTLTVYAA